MSTLLPKLNLKSDVIGDIQNAIAVGQNVVVSENEVAKNNWAGVGYIVSDPETGAGAYLISGGLNGGEQEPCDKKPSPAVSAVVQYTVAAFMAVMLIIIIMSGLGLITLPTLGEVAVALRVALLAIASLPSVVNAFPADCDPCGSNRGRIQAQGGGLEKSVFWAQSEPFTLVQGLALLDSLVLQLTPKEKLERERGIKLAKKAMINHSKGGGVCSKDYGVSKSYPKLVNKRIDIEVRAGVAFVP